MILQWTFRAISGELSLSRAPACNMFDPECGKARNNSQNNNINCVYACICVYIYIYIYIYSTHLISNTLIEITIIAGSLSILFFSMLFLKFYC